MEFVSGIIISTLYCKKYLHSASNFPKAVFLNSFYLYTENLGSVFTLPLFSPVFSFSHSRMLEVIKHDKISISDEYSLSCDRKHFGGDDFFFIKEAVNTKSSHLRPDFDYTF